MIGLWTRAAQARCICNCSACVAATGRLAQKTARASLRQRIGWTDTFTAFSSTLVFSAAVADGMKKDRKLQGWDKIIEETRAEIEAVEQDQKNRLQKMNAIALDKSHDSALPSQVEQAWLGRMTWAEMLEWADIQDRDRVADGIQDVRGIKPSILQNLTEMDLRRLLLSKRILHRFYGGPDCSSLEHVPHTYPYSPKKLRTLEWSILKLIVRLLNHSEMPSDIDKDKNAQATRLIHTFCRPPNATKEQILEDVENTDRRLGLLKSEPRESELYRTFPSPALLRYNHSPSEQEDQLMNFNVRLQELLQSTCSLTTENISRICTFLLSSSTAPDIHTYNLLLVRFCQLRAEPLVAATFDSLRETHMRSNEITHATLLRYFTLTNKKADFSDYVRRMNGFNRGLALADSHQKIDPLAASRYRSFGVSSIRIAELARLNSEVYTCLIKGFLEMFDFNEAVWYYANMVREGWKPTLELLTALLKHCCETFDFVSGWRVWKSMLESCQPEQHISRIGYEIMLELCRRCEKTRLYGWIIQDGLNCGALPKHFAKTSRIQSHVENDHTQSSRSAIATAVGHTITVTELQDRFPYISVGIIRERLRNASTTTQCNYAQSLGSTYLYTTEFVYTIMRRALIQASFADAKEHIEEHILVSRGLKRAMLNEAIWVFRLQQELSELNQTHIANAQISDNDNDSVQSRESLRDDYDALIEGDNQPSSSNPEQMTHSNLVAEIEAMDSKLTPKMVVTAYNEFRRGAVGQQGTTEEYDPPQINRWSSKNFRPNEAGDPWMRTPIRNNEVEAG